ncbi:hypothetical protein [Endozoicomonas sp. ONNA2]|nr:hypothetical protein [Endozoicomonas sp. ONNA2]
MDLSAYNHNRSDKKLIRYGSGCNILTLFLTLVMIFGFTQAG